METLPRILIVGRVAWNTSQSTLTGIFGGYPADRLAYVCIETQDPDFTHCARHFQISEIAMIKKLFRWGTKTGRERLKEEFSNRKEDDEVQSLERHESSVMGWVRQHRSVLFLYARDLLWRLGGWKSKELKCFIDDFKPDVLFFVGDPLPLMNRLQRHIKQVAQLPSAIFMMDDIWSYKNDHHYFMRYLLRQQVRKLIPVCQAHFAISEMMKREYDQEFGINCQILTKGIPESTITPEFSNLHSPIRFVYTGKLLYGRERTLKEIAQALHSINQKAAGTKAELYIYTQTEITPQLDKDLNIPGSSFVHPPVPYHEVAGILQDSDVVLFTESLEKRQRYIARLSFSTKITDYLAMGKCIFAVGDAGIAPIDYLRQENAAVTCTSYTDIPQCIAQLVSNPEIISEYAERAYKLGQKKHNAKLMDQRIKDTILSIAPKFIP